VSELPLENCRYLNHLSQLLSFCKKKLHSPKIIFSKLLYTQLSLAVNSICGHLLSWDGDIAGSQGETGITCVVVVIWCASRLQWSFFWLICTILRQLGLPQVSLVRYFMGSVAVGTNPGDGPTKLQIWLQLRAEVVYGTFF